MDSLPQFVIERVFDAPRDLVWTAWTDPELVARWYGPGVETVIHQFDLKPGGLWLNEMRMKGMSDFSRMEFVDITPPESLSWIHYSTNEAWETSPNMHMPDWPRSLLTEVTFTDKGASTTVRLTWTPYQATDTEIACFNVAKDGFGGGWGSGFNIIDEVLAELKG